MSCSSSAATAAACVEPLTQYEIQRGREIDVYCEHQKGIAITAYVVAHFSADEQQKQAMIQKAEQNFRAYTCVQGFYSSMHPIINNHDEVAAKAEAVSEEIWQESGQEHLLIMKILWKLRNIDLAGMRRLNGKPDESLPRIEGEGKK